MFIMYFEDLDVWRRSARLATDVFIELDKCRNYGFKDQITRSALSVPSNIAEGFERNSNKDTIRFLYYAKGSCGELRTQIYIGIEIGFIPKKIGSIWVSEAKEQSKMKQGLINSLKQRD